MDASRTLIRSNQQGFALIYLALILVGMLGIAALVIDIGHMFVVKSELQNAADAAALSGAMKIYSSSSNPSIAPTPRWNEAKQRAESDISLNKSDGFTLVSANNGEVQVGYWDTVLRTLPLKSSALTPTSNEVPAVQVNTFRSGTNSVPTFFANVISDTFQKAAVKSGTAIAVRGFPSQVQPGQLFPAVLSKCLSDNYFAQNPLPDPPPTIRIYSSYKFPSGAECETGQWSSLLVDASDVPTIRDLINNGNPTPLTIGDTIYVEPGVKSSIYDEIEQWINSGHGEVLMPIVNTVLSGNTSTPLVGFAAFKITLSVKKDKYFEGHFLTYYETKPGTTTPGGGPYYGVVTPPVLVH